MNFVKQTVILCAGILAASVAEAQHISTFAGKHALGTTISGDGGPATDAGISYPYGIAADAAGNVYIDGQGYIRKVNTAGIISTIAGTGTIGYSGDGGPATNAKVGSGQGLAVDAAGNIYIADIIGSVIRKINISGIISTIAGNGTTGYCGDGGVAVDSALTHPSAVAVDAAGNVYFSDYSARVRMVDAAGMMHTIAGTGYSGNTGDGGPASAAQVGFPSGLAFDPSGNLYMVDRLYGEVRKISPGGIISTIAGTGYTGYSGDGGPASVATFNFPNGIVLDAAGNMYIADNMNNVVRKINTGGTVSTYAGNGYAGYSGDGGPAAAAMISNNWNIASDAYGRIYIADDNNYVVRRVDTTSDHAPIAEVKSDTVLMLCEHTANMLDTALAASDADMGQSETWTVQVPPAHGMLAGFAVTKTTTGGLLTPSGLTYTPTTGYTGVDTFAIVISDGTSATVKHMAVNVQPTTAGTITGARNIVHCDPIYLSDTVSGGTWSVTTGNVAVFGGIITYGSGLGNDTVLYTITNSCGIYTATYPVAAVICEEKVNNVNGSENNINIYPNPSFGLFTVDMPDNAVAIAVYDIMGRSILTRNVTQLKAGQQSIDLNGMPAVNYILKVTTPEQVFTGRLELR